MPTHQEQVKDIAATKIQALTRGFFSRNEFKLSSIPSTHRLLSPLFIKGNDPEINKLPRYLSDKKIIIIGTSGLRIVELACKLGGKLPKIVLVDNSRNVIEFWHALKDVAITSLHKKEFINNLFPEDDLSPKPVDACWKVCSYLLELFDSFGFDRVKKIIAHATILPQKWEDKKTFKSLRCVITLHQYDGVYVYPSNISAFLWACNQENKTKQVLNNIELLNPDLAIHTNLGFRGIPDKVVYIPKGQHRSEDVLERLRLKSFNLTLFMRVSLPVFFTVGVGMLLYYLKASNDIFIECPTSIDRFDVGLKQ